MGRASDNDLAKEQIILHELPLYGIIRYEKLRKYGEMTIRGETHNDRDCGAWVWCGRFRNR